MDIEVVSTRRRTPCRYCGAAAYPERNRETSQPPHQVGKILPHVQQHDVDCRVGERRHQRPNWTVVLSSLENRPTAAGQGLAPGKGDGDGVRRAAGRGVRRRRGIEPWNRNRLAGNVAGLAVSRR